MVLRTHTNTSATSFSLESSEWAKTNLDTRAVVDTFPSNFGPEGMGDGNFYDWVPDGEFRGYDENVFPRSLDGRLMDAYEVLKSTASASAPTPASRLLCETQCWSHVSDSQQIGPGMMRIHFEKLLNEYGENELIPVYLEIGTPNFSLNREVKSEEIHSVRDAEQCFDKESQQSGNDYGRAVRL